MAESTNWAFPPNLQPKPEEVKFDLARTLGTVVQLRAEAPEDAFSAGILGTERVGNGVVIREDGLILTIGYLITEAHTIWLSTNDGTVIGGHAMAYDSVTGFGLVLPLGRLRAPAMELGSASSVGVDDDVVVIGYGGCARSLKAKIVAKREFAGYWEYLLDEALFTSPAHPQWGGTALVNRDGKLVGLGSLLVQEARRDGEALQGNMFVPIDLLKPILDDLLSLGRQAGLARPWLGFYAVEVDNQVVISGVASGGPAAAAGMRKGDVVLEVSGAPVSGVADLFRKLWKTGPAGTEISIRLARAGSPTSVKVNSVDRQALLKKPRLH